MAKLPRPRRRLPRVPISRIKAGCTYDTNDIAKLLGFHRNTVRHWLKQGLAAIDDRRPLLVHGTVLKAFLLDGPPDAIENCDFEEDLAHVETEPAE
jgi:hypothetical protein